MVDETRSFHAVLFPHRSLSRAGFRRLLVVVGAILGLAAARAWALGAWPVALFVIADIGLVWLAFTLSYRSARQFEEVSIGEGTVRVRKVSAAGRVTEHTFPAFWARLTVDRREEEGVTRVALGSHGRSVVLGAFLNPADRASFADAFGEALDRARQPA